MLSSNANKRSNGYGKPTVTQLALPLLLSALAIGLWLLPQFAQLLDWSRQDLNQGQYWRLISGHLLHSNDAHLWMNLGGLWLIWGLFQPYFTRTLTLASLAMMLIISIGIWFGVPSIGRYVGLSALLHGLFCWGALEDIRHQRRSGWLLLAGGIAKVTWENLMGASDTTATLIEARVAVESHLLGVIAALLCWCGWQGYCRITSR